MPPTSRSSPPAAVPERGQRSVFHGSEQFGKWRCTPHRGSRRFPQGLGRAHAIDRRAVGSDVSRDSSLPCPANVPQKVSRRRARSPVPLARSSLVRHRARQGGTGARDGALRSFAARAASNSPATESGSRLAAFGTRGAARPNRGLRRSHSASRSGSAEPTPSIGGSWEAARAGILLRPLPSQCATEGQSQALVLAAAIGVILAYRTPR